MRRAEPLKPGVLAIEVGCRQHVPTRAAAEAPVHEHV
jgi:hypothetical protein